MMNTRIIELLQQPKLITTEDLSLLENQIQQHPYVQNIRALYLYGIHQYQPHRYKEILTKTAAYTTDKKILYQFVNQKSYQKSIDKLKDNEDQKATESVSNSQLIEVKEKEILKTDLKDSKEEAVLIKEENSTNEVSQQVITEESVDEVSKEELIVDDKKVIAEEPKLVINDDEVDNEEALETKTDVEEVVSKKEIEEQPEIANQAISFDVIEDFLPNVKFEVPKNHNTFLNPPKFDQVKTINEVVEKPQTTDLIEEDSTKIIIVDEPISEFQPSEVVNLESDEVKEVAVLEVQETVVPLANEMVEQSPKVWQPMQLDNQLPDALIGKTVDSNHPTEENRAINASIIVEKFVDNKEQELVVEDVIQEESAIEATSEESRPIINVSFFSDELSIKSDEGKKNIDSTLEKEIVTEAKIESPLSNVGKFINTWQSWLKIDRSEETEKEKEVQKNKAIEQFIENQPKISQLKDEVSFVVKEKKEDISHLMTETLANLYLEQRLYTKAIKAFEILIAKHPEKKKHFLTRIEEIKDIRKPF